MHRQGTRIEWADVPASVRAGVDALAGSRVVRATNVGGGFSPGPAARCELADGRVVFVKACGSSLNPIAPGMHRREATVLAALPDDFPAPRLIGVVDDGDWVALVVEHVDGRMPVAPVSADDVTAVLRAMESLSEAGTPNPVRGLDPVGVMETSDPFGWAWRSVATSHRDDPRLDEWTRSHLDTLVELESTWPQAAAGTTLLHGDVRIDNILLRRDDACFVDWPAASVGARWVDLVGLLPALHLDGAPPPALLFDTHPLGRAADPDRVDVYLAALAGYFTHRSLLPPPPRIESLRSFQTAQGRVCRAWLAERLRWH